MSKLSIGGTRRQRKCFSHYESMINGRKSPKYDCIVLVLTLLVTIKEIKVVICLVKCPSRVQRRVRSRPGLCCDNLAR